MLDVLPPNNNFTMHAYIQDRMGSPYTVVTCMLTVKWALHRITVQVVLTFLEITESLECMCFQRFLYILLKKVML